MSDLLDEFARAAEKTGMVKSTDPQYVEKRMSYTRDIEKNCPPAVPFVKSMSEDARNILRRVYRRLVGVPMKTSQEAYDRTMPPMSGALVPLYFEALTLGFLIGQKFDPAVGEDVWGPMVEDKEFREVAKTKSLEFSLEADLSVEITGYSRWVFENFCEQASFMTMPDEVAGSKVWDCWWFCAQVACSHLFATGYEMGSERRVMEALQGIAQASRLEVEGDGN